MENTNLTNVLDVVLKANESRDILMSYSEAYGGE